MINLNLPGSRASVPKPGHHAFELIRKEHTSICSSNRTLDWANDLPDFEAHGRPAKRQALHELHGNRLSRPRRPTTRSLTKMSTSPASFQNNSRRKGKGIEKTEKSVATPGLRRSARSTQVSGIYAENIMEEEESNDDPFVDESSAFPKIFPIPSLSSKPVSTESASERQSQSQVSYSSRKSTTRSNSSSPLRRITAERLALYAPRITFVDYAVQAKRPHLLTEPVRTLWKDFIRPCGEDSSSIPMQLKDKVARALDTPEKSRIPPPAHMYENSNTYNEEDLEKIFPTMDDILEQARTWRAKDVPESHWCDQVVSPLLNLVQRLDCSKGEVTEHKPRAVTLNITTIDIQPLDLFPYPNSAQLFKTLNRKIDYAMGLMLPDRDLQVLHQAVYLNENSVPSINQTDRFVNFMPTFLNIEVKRRVSDVDPQIQLAVWVTAEFKKRAVEKYGRNMPVVAIAITGDAWDLWIAYEPSWNKEAVDEVTFLGPLSMGSTRDWQGIFSILRYLIAIVTWGRTKYYQWFDQNVMSMYRKTN